MLRTRTTPLAPTVAACGLALLAAAPAASAAPRSEARYDVTFKAESSERWQYRYASTDDCRLTGEMCTKETTGAGTAKVVLRTPKPQRVLVMRGAKGRPPVVGVGEGGLRVIGESVREGTLRTVYGGPWRSGNPDVVAPTRGCGRTPLRDELSFAWSGRRALYPSVVLSPDHGDCPDGPGPAPTWKDGASPSIMAALADVAPSRFLGAKQFTVRGTRTFTGTFPSSSTSSRFGSVTAGGDLRTTWRWEATFRMRRR